MYQDSKRSRTYGGRERNNWQDWGSGDGLARAWELAAIELEQSLRQQQGEALNLREAARECGLSANHLGELIRQGKIPQLRQDECSPNPPGRPPHQTTASTKNIRND